MDILIENGLVFDGTGAAARTTDIGITADRIVFIGDSQVSGIKARTVIDATNLAVLPGFIDMHSHAELHLDYGRDAAPYLHQGITTAVLGVDGGGEVDVASHFAEWEEGGIAINGLLYVGHGKVRSAAMGQEDRQATASEMLAMKKMVRNAMDDGAFGLSTGLFYVPGAYASTEEVIELTKVAAEYDGAIYDTHDRDLGAAYQGIGYDASVAEGIRIAKESGIRAIFSHYNLQGRQNAGRADVGAAYINDARANGIDVWAAQHPYTATQSSLRAYTIPAWAAAGGHDEMLRRFDDPDTRDKIYAATREMLDIRGGAGQILLVDDRPGLNGVTLEQYAKSVGVPPHEAAQKILRGGNAVVMNLDLYDAANTRRLATEPWMMTCTDGRTPKPEQTIAHPRTFGAFPMKYRLFVREEAVLDEATLFRGYTGLAADFLGLDDRGYIKVGYKADIVVLDRSRYRDEATYDEPRRLASGVEHVIVNGRFAIRDGSLTGELAGEPIRRGFENQNIRQ